MGKQDLSDSLYFLKRFLNGPRQVASVWPSSRFLARQMFADLPLADGDLVIEYGPGTGAFTSEVLRLREAGLELAYLGVEKDPGMHTFLTQRFPGLDFVLGDAADVRTHCLARDLPEARAVISGLPLIFFDWKSMRDIVHATRASLARDGVFRTFSYVHSYPTRGAMDLRGLMRDCFEDFSLSRPVLRNLPPAFALTGRLPVEAPLAASVLHTTEQDDGRLAPSFGD
ncbi:MAG: phospholipid methyltransferase [Pseudomonadota bacterium]